jgi:hypothetical protein
LPTDPYVYPGTDCLRNRAGIRDTRALAWLRLEREHNIEAARASHRGDNSPLHELLEPRP